MTLINNPSDPIPCTLHGWTHGTLNAWATAGPSLTDTWEVRSVCGKVSIRVSASWARHKVDCDGLPEFNYE